MSRSCHPISAVLKALTCAAVDELHDRFRMISALQANVAAAQVLAVDRKCGWKVRVGSLSACEGRVS